MYDAVAGPTSILRGVKNVVGGMLAIDGVHSKCMQKTICDRFADEVIEEKPELDPVKRSWVLKRKVVKPRGNWRWMGDIIVNGVSRVARRIGFVPNSNRRHGGNPILGPIASFVHNNWQQIPWTELIQ